MHQYLAEWQTYVTTSIQNGQDRWVDLESYAFYRDNDLTPELATASESLTDVAVRWRESVAYSVRQDREFLPQGWTEEDIQKAQSQSVATWKELEGPQLWHAAFGGVTGSSQHQSPNNEDGQSQTGDQLWAKAFEVPQ